MLAELERFYADYCSSIRREADALRGEKVPAVTEELFAIYENTGKRLIYEGVYFLRRKYLAVFGLKAILDGEERDILKLEEVIRDICGEECWALPAHVNRKADENWRIYVDLFASETAQTLAEITYMLKDRLSAEVSEEARREVMRRVLVPFAQSRAPYGHWEYGESNWCAVCGGSIGSAAIYLLGERAEQLTGGETETLRRILDRVCYSLEHYYLKSFAGDGTCLEGLGYFTYGMTYFTGFAQQLYEFTGGKRDLFQNEKLAKIAAFQAKCYFPSGKTVSFADGFTDDTFRPGLTCYLAQKYPEAGIPPMERAAGLNDDNCYRWMGLYRNLAWTKDYTDFLRRGECAGMVNLKVASGEPDTAGSVKSEKLSGERSFAGTAASKAASSVREPAREAAASQIILPDAQWSICRSRNGAGMAAKGGHNGEPHNHNDVGSFFYLNGKEFLLADLGCGEYTRDYFSEKRYDFLCCRSLGHNVPLINDREQMPGSGYGCSSFEADGLGRTVIGFGGAYANPELKSLVRTLDWNEENGTLSVRDCFKMNGRLQSIKENLITEWEPEICGNTIRIKGKSGGCLVTVEGVDGAICRSRREFSDHGGIRRDVWLLQWEVPLEGAEGETQSCFRVEML